MHDIQVSLEERIQRVGHHTPMTLGIVSLETEKACAARNNLGERLVERISLSRHVLEKSTSKLGPVTRFPVSLAYVPRASQTREMNVSYSFDRKGVRKRGLREAALSAQREFADIDDHPNPGVN